MTPMMNEHESDDALRHDPTWPYEDLEPRETLVSTPTWVCPAMGCVCHPGRETPPVSETFSIVLCDERARRMPNARCRVLDDGILLNDDDAHRYAGPTGRIEISCFRLPELVLVEWAPRETPLDPRYPFRKHYYVKPARSDRAEAARRRLHNLGYSRRASLEDNIRDFQNAYLQEATGELDDVADQLEAFHDRGMIPPVRARAAHADDAIRLVSADGFMDPQVGGPLPADPQDGPDPGGGNPNGGAVSAGGAIYVAKLVDITNSKADLEDAGAQSGRGLPGDQVSKGYPDGTAPLPLLPVLNLDKAACGSARLLTDRQKQQTALRGSLRILKATAPDAAQHPPAMFLIWIPDALTTFDFHVYFMPVLKDIDPTVDYPLGRVTVPPKDPTAPSTLDQPYVAKGYRHLMWMSWGNYQHDLARVSCIYVVPIPSRTLQQGSLTAAVLADWLREIAAMVRRERSPGPYTDRPFLERVALSAFSAGNQYVQRILNSAGPRDKTGNDFLTNNVGEVYLFDPPASQSTDTATAIRNWQQRPGGRRVVRVYTAFAGAYQTFVPLVTSAQSQRRAVTWNGAGAQAEEVNSSKGTAVFVPANVIGDDKNCKIPIASDAHEWFLQFFMAHALNASWFERIKP